MNCEFYHYIAYLDQNITFSLWSLRKQQEALSLLMPGVVEAVVVTGIAVSPRLSRLLVPAQHSTPEPEPLSGCLPGLKPRHCLVPCAWLHAPRVRLLRHGKEQLDSGVLSGAECVSLCVNNNVKPFKCLVSLGMAMNHLIF